MGGKGKNGRDGDENLEDSVLWRLSMQDVVPLSRSKRKNVTRKALSPESGPSGARGRPVVPVKTAEKGKNKNPDSLLSSRRRERVKIEARIDLHGLTQDAAHSALSRFLAQCHVKDLRLVLVITGKGLKENENPDHWAEPRSGVLRRLVPEWLRTGTLARIVGEVQTAGPRHGGEGALYVRLKRKV